ncbi:MAG: MAPEG family protein [Erythrobacter sp.]
MTVPIFPITATFVAICAIVMFLLIAWVGLRRGAIKALHGDASDAALRKRIRIHGNFIETAPLVALAIWASEAMEFPQIWLWLSVASFFLGRVLHAIWFEKTVRGIAMLFTTLPAMGLGAAILLKLWL